MSVWRAAAARAARLLPASVLPASVLSATVLSPGALPARGGTADTSGGSADTIGGTGDTSGGSADSGKARRRDAWLAGTGLGAAALLRASFAAKAGSSRFYLLTAGLAGTWTAGALGATRIPWRGEGRPGSRAAGQPARPVDAARDLIVVPVMTGAASFALFYAAGHVVRRHPALRRVIGSVFHYADAGSTPLVVLIAATSGVAEELYFRGALWSGPRPLRSTTLAYAVSTSVTGNPALVLAGVATSLVFGWQRAATGGVIAPAVTHVTWSILMLRYIPPLFRDPDQAARNPTAP